MNQSWVRRLLAAAIAVAVFVGSAYLMRSARSGHLLPFIGDLFPRGIQPPTPIATSCVRDLSDLPPPPAGPEGRPSNYLHTCGSHIYDSRGRVVKITGINWSGMENSDYAPGGLGNRNWQEILDQIAALGYNTIRIPFSSEAIDAGQQIGGVNFALNPDLQGLSGLQMLDRLVEGARARGLKVILDRHQPTSSGRTALWYSSEVPEDRWISDWRVLAARYKGNDTVIAGDLGHRRSRDRLASRRRASRERRPRREPVSPGLRRGHRELPERPLLVGRQPRRRALSAGSPARAESRRVQPSRLRPVRLGSAVVSRPELPA